MADVASSGIGKIVYNIVNSVGSPIGLLNSILVINIFCRWKNIDSIVTIFIAMGITDLLAFGCVGLKMLSGSITAQIYHSVIDAISDVASCLSMWMVVLVTIFKFATTLNHPGISGWYRLWTVPRARIAICLTYVVIAIATIPNVVVSAVKRSSDREERRDFNRGAFVTMSVFVPKIIPSVVMLSMGVGIIVNRCRRSTGDTNETDEGQTESQGQRNEANVSAMDAKNSHDNKQGAQDICASVLETPEQSGDAMKMSQDPDAKDTEQSKTEGEHGVDPKDSQEPDAKTSEKGDAKDTEQSKTEGEDGVDPKDSQEPDAKTVEPKDSQEPDAKTVEPKDSQEPDAKTNQKRDARDTEQDKAGDEDTIVLKDSQDKALTEKEEAKRKKKEEKERKKAELNEKQQVRVIIFLIVFYSFVDLTTGSLMFIAVVSPVTLTINNILVVSFRILSFTKHCLSYSIYFSMYAEFRAIYRTTFLYKFFNCCKLRRRRQKMKKRMAKRIKKGKKEDSEEEEDEDNEENEDEDDDDDMDDDGGDCDFEGE